MPTSDGRREQAEDGGDVVREIRDERTDRLTECVHPKGWVHPAEYQPLKAEERYGVCTVCGCDNLNCVCEVS